MVPQCGVCNAADFKYKCPVCEMKYCSIPCYRNHRFTHEGAGPGNEATNGQSKQPTVDRPETTQRMPKLDFSGFENDQDLQRLLSRFPTLKYQLQLLYGLTLEPGPEDATRWSHQDWWPDGRDSVRSGRARGNAGRGCGRGGGRGRGRGGRNAPEGRSEGRPRGPWTQEKGDGQALDTMRKMQKTPTEEVAEGMEEFVRLCQIKFQNLA